MASTVAAPAGTMFWSRTSGVLPTSSSSVGYSRAIARSVTPARAIDLWGGRSGWNTPVVSRVGCCCLGPIALAVAVCCAAAAAMQGQARVGATSGCAEPTLDASYVNAVNAALAQKQDVWGNELLQSPAGPTYAGVAHYLKPLMLVGPPRGTRRLTESGVHYLAFRPARRSGGVRSLDFTSPTEARSCRSVRRADD